MALRADSVPFHFFCAALSLVCGFCAYASAQSSSPISVVEGTGLTAPTRAKPLAKISLRLVVVTDDTTGAGTDNAVYFDVGPWSWKLNKRFRNDFERGRTDIFPLKVPPGFSLSDILWLRLQKKGLLGITGTGDGLTGAWHPQHVSLLVDGTEYASADVTDSLNSRYWFWTKQGDVDPYAGPASFSRFLRLQPNKKLSWVDKATGFATTPMFKKRGWSGWLNCPEEKEDSTLGKPCSRLPVLACATGKVFRSPAVSNDGLATIDLVLEALEFCSDTVVCAQRAEIPDQQDPKRWRYLRVEYLHRDNPVPKKDEQVRICGNLKWDTDREGWWELHPRDCRDVIWQTEGVRCLKNAKH